MCNVQASRIENRDIYIVGLVCEYINIELHLKTEFPVGKEYGTYGHVDEL